MDKKHCKYWIAFSAIEEIGSVFIKKLYEHFSDIEQAWNAPLAEIYEIENITKKQADVFAQKRRDVNPDKCFEEIAKRNYTVLNYDDDNYPCMLKNISNPPMTLYIKGDLSRCNLDMNLSVVGSRRASQEAKNNLANIIDEFRGTEVTIVSGGALGIDTIAHQSAIKNDLSTIAVVGSGFDCIYPASNVSMFKQIEDFAGAVITEYWYNFEPMPFRFPHRNRIVSGLSKGTLVAEAALKSGALITANLCLEQNRELMCMPGALNNPNTQGIYKLLKSGAALVTCADDILEAMNWQITKNPAKGTELNLSEDEKTVYDIISIDKLTFDGILAKSQIEISELMVILTTLELNGLISQIEGEKYSTNLTRI